MPSFSPEAAQEYVDSGGDYCPACHSNNVTAGESEWEGNLVSQKVTCDDCGCVWYDWFKLYSAQPRDAYEAQKAAEDTADVEAAEAALKNIEDDGLIQLSTAEAFCAFEQARKRFPELNLNLTVYSMFDGGGWVAHVKAQHGPDNTNGSYMATPAEAINGALRVLYEFEGVCIVCKQKKGDSLPGAVCDKCKTQETEHAV